MNPNTPISAIMTTSLVTVSPVVSVAEINRIFEEYSFHHIPVVENGALVGIISKQDLMFMEQYLWPG